MITLLLAYVIVPRIEHQPDGWTYLITVLVDLGIIYGLGSGIREVLISFATKQPPK